MTAENNFIGIVCGLSSEARCLAGVRSNAVRVHVSGANALRAYRFAKKLIDDGATGLVSFGLSGALCPNAKTGSLLLADTVVFPSLDKVETSPEWTRRLQSAAHEAELSVQVAPVYGSDDLIGTPTEKSALFEKTGAVAVDMESLGVAQAAFNAARPFVALRAVADPAHRNIPASAARIVGEAGRIRPLAALGAVLRQPSDLPTFIRLGKESQTGLTSLRRGADKLFPALVPMF